MFKETKDNYNIESKENYVWICTELYPHWKKMDQFNDTGVVILNNGRYIKKGQALSLYNYKQNNTY